MTKPWPAELAGRPSEHEEHRAVQRFGGALNLNVHFHSLVIDGVYLHGPRGATFLPLPPPDDAAVAGVAGRFSRRLTKLLERCGLAQDHGLDDEDPLSREQPLLAALYSASIRGRIASGARAGGRVARLGDRIDPEDLPATSGPAISGPRCATIAGVSVHANVAVPAQDRQRLERLCRYVARPPVASERLSVLPDGRVAYALRHPYRDGTTHVAFDPVDFIGKLAALVPPPRFNLVRYHGVLAAAARLRADIVPEGEEPGREAAACRHANGKGGRAAEAGSLPDSPSSACEGSPPAGAPSESAADATPARRPPRLRNYTWAELMRRVWEVDVLECPACGGRMRIIAALHAAEAIRAILECLGLPSRGAPVAPPAPEHEAEGNGDGFDFDFDPVAP